MYMLRAAEGCWGAVGVGLSHACVVRGVWSLVSPEGAGGRFIIRLKFVYSYVWKAQKNFGIEG